MLEIIKPTSIMKKINIFYISIKKYLSLFTHNTNTLFSSSDYCACALKNIVGLKNDFKVIYVGIDTSRYKPTNSGDVIREKFNIPSTSKVILFLGRMNPEMGLDLFLDNYNKFYRLDYIKRKLKEGNIDIIDLSTKYKKKYKFLDFYYSRYSHYTEIAQQIIADDLIEFINSK